MHRLRPLLSLLLLTVSAPAAPAFAQMTAGPSDDVETIMNGLGPGDELILDDGMYTLSGRFGVSSAGIRDCRVSQGDGIEVKEGSSGNVIRDNVLWNCGDHGIQSAADATIRNNIILSAGSDGIAMQPHQTGIPSNLMVVHNTILKATNDYVTADDFNGTDRMGVADIGAYAWAAGGNPGWTLAAGFKDATGGGTPPGGDGGAGTPDGGSGTPDGGSGTPDGGDTGVVGVPDDAGMPG